MRWRKLLHNVGYAFGMFRYKHGDALNQRQGQASRCLWLQIYTWLRFTGFFYTDLLKYMTFPTNFPLSHFAGGGWGFVAEKPKRESNLIPLIFVTPTGFKPVTF